MARNGSKPVPATVQQAIQTRDGGWRLMVRIDGSKITALVTAPEPLGEGARVVIVGSGTDWRLAA